MQNHKKLSARILSLALSATMVFTSFPATVFAAEGDAAPGTSGIEKTTRTITAFDELGEDFSKSVPFDGYTYIRNVALNTPFEELKLPTELGVTVENTTITKGEPAAPSDTEPAPAADEPASTEPAPAADEPASTEPVAEPTDEPAAPSDA
ncbi:MAG: hypothetical protein RR263_05780, partial [Oscillospiraceae bacterium]